MNKHDRAIALNCELSIEAKGLYFIITSYEAETGKRMFDLDASEIERICKNSMLEIYRLSDEIVSKHMKKNKWCLK